MIKIALFGAALCGGAFLPVTVYAGDKPAVPLAAPVQQGQPENKDAADATFAKIKAIAARLNENDQKHFYLIYTNNNIISTVKMVRSDIQNAINACGEANPDMKTTLNTHFADWKAQVDPVLKDAGANLNNMVVAQDYAPAGDINNIFKSLEAIRAKNAAAVNKVPVTTPDACKYLQEKLDTTRDTLTNLLHTTLISYGRAFPPAVDANRPAPIPAAEGARKP